MNMLPSLSSDRLSKLNLPPCTSELLAAETYYDHPPTEFPVVQKPEDYKRPRTVMILTVFREALLREYLLRGLTRSGDDKLRLPERGSITKEEIDEISTSPLPFPSLPFPPFPHSSQTALTLEKGPLELSKNHKYPPTYQIMGANDDVFELSHAVKFHAALGRSGSQRQTMILFEAGHSFDIQEDIEGEVHKKIITPAVEWVAGFAGFAGVKAKLQRSARGGGGCDIGKLGCLIEK
jgi:hypothetical protein